MSKIIQIKRQYVTLPYSMFISFYNFIYFESAIMADYFLCLFIILLFNSFPTVKSLVKLEFQFD